MAKAMSVFVEIGAKLGANFSSTIDVAEGRLKRLSNAFKANAIAAKGQMNEIAESYRGLAKMAAAGGIVFSVKHAFKDGEELAHELSNMRSAGRTVEEVAEGLREANKTIAEMPTATLANSVKLLNETTGAYGDFKHAVENLAFNSKLGDVLKNVVGVEDPAHELGSLVKALEIRTSASNPERYKSEAAKLGQAEVFYGGRLRADQFRDFASNSTVGVKQLDERFLTRIAPALIQEQTGEKVGTGLTAFRTIISGRKITDKKQAEAWQKLGLLNPKDVIRNKMGDVTGWKDGAIKGTAMAYADPLEFMEKVILPRLQAQGVDINDQMKLGQALNTLFKNTKASAFVSSISTAADRLRLHKDEALMNGVLSIDDIYDSALLNDPKMASFAIKSAMTNIGAALTLPLMKPFAQTMVSIARAVNHLSAALIDHPEIAAVIAKLGAALLTWQAIRFANLVFGVTAFARSIANLTLAVSIGLAARLVGISRAIVTFAASERLAAGLRAFAGALYMVTLGAPAYLANRLRSIAGGILMLQAVGGRAAVLGAMAGAMASFGRAVVAFPLMALRGIAVGMWALVANPVGLVLTGIVAALTALGAWVYNNWGGIVSFFGAFGHAFMAALGPKAAGAIGKVIDWLGDVWRWLSNLLGPLDATGEKWRAWGEWAGKGVGTAVNALIGLPGVILDFAQKAWDALVNFDWAAAGRAILSKIGGALGGIGGYLAGKLGFNVSPPGTPLEARAAGGPVSSRTPYLVGEHGPEIFVPSAAGKIETNAVLKAAREPASVGDAAGKAQAASAAIRGLDTAVMPVVFTGSIDEATRRAAKLRGMLDAVKKSPIVAMGDWSGGDAGEGELGGGGFGAGARGFGGFGGAGSRRSGSGGGSPVDLKEGPIAKFNTGKLFEQKAPQVMARLQRDFGLNQTEAAAVLGNLGHESAGFKAFAEGGHGPGRGWAQWTDPGRKRRFFEYAQKNGLDPKSDEANYGFLKWELSHTHKGAIDALKAAHTPEEKMRAFERVFEGARVKANGSRMRYMNQALQAAEKAPAVADKDPAQKAGADADKAFVAAGKAPDWMDDRSKRELSGVNKELAENLIEASNRSGLKFAVNQGRRTQEEANANAASGRGVKNSQHLYGAAADIAMLDPKTGQKVYDRALYERFAKSFDEVNAQRGMNQRWLGSLGGRWGKDIVHFDQGLGYGQSHKPNPFGGQAPTDKDKVASREEAYRSPQNPFVTHAKLAGARAMGGPVGRGLSYLVGERGPEIFTPGASGQISTHGVLGKLADVGKAVTDGTGQQIVPSPERVAAARPYAEAKPSSSGDRSFHAGSHTWNIKSERPHDIRREVEGLFMDFIRQMESAQSGSLSD